MCHLFALRFWNVGCAKQAPARRLARASRSTTGAPCADLRLNC